MSKTPHITPPWKRIPKKINMGQLKSSLIAFLFFFFFSSFSFSHSIFYIKTVSSRLFFWLWYICGHFIVNGAIHIWSLKLDTVFPHIRPAGIIFSWGLQLRVLLEITKFHLHKSVPGPGIIWNAGIIRGRVLYEEIQ